MAQGSFVNYPTPHKLGTLIFDMVAGLPRSLASFREQAADAVGVALVAAAGADHGVGRVEPRSAVL